MILPWPIKLKAGNPAFLLLGERGGKKPDGFEYGNSPTQIAKLDFTDKTLVQTTSAGTQGIVNATSTDEIITGGFVNVQAILTYITAQKPEVASLVAMGSAGVRPADEDRLCAEYIRSGLQAQPSDFSGIVAHLRNSVSARQFFDPVKDWAPLQDFDLCLALDKFNFVLKVEFCGSDQVCLKKIEA